MPNRLHTSLHVDWLTAQPPHAENICQQSETVQIGLLAADASQ